MLFWAKNCVVFREVWVGALSWWTSQSPIVPNFRFSSGIVSQTLQNIPVNVRINYNIIGDQFIPHFYLFCLCLSALNACHLEMNDNPPWNANAIEKSLFDLKLHYQKPCGVFQEFMLQVYRAVHKIWCIHAALFGFSSQTAQNTTSKKIRRNKLRAHTLKSSMWNE